MKHRININAPYLNQTIMQLFYSSRYIIFSYVFWRASAPSSVSLMQCTLYIIKGSINGYRILIGNPEVKFILGIVWLK